MDRELVERPRLGEERVDPSRAMAFEVVASERRGVEQAGELGADAGDRGCIDDVLDDAVSVVVQSRAHCSRPSLGEC